MTKLLAVLLMVAANSAWADFTYDWRTGNSYYTTKGVSGDTKVRGYNMNTGSTWNTTVESDGDMKGTDSDGNMWNYNKSTGTYINYSTGKICTGKGAFRTCN